MFTDEWQIFKETIVMWVIYLKISIYSLFLKNYYKWYALLHKACGRSHLAQLTLFFQVTEERKNSVSRWTVTLWPCLVSAYNQASCLPCRRKLGPVNELVNKTTPSSIILDCLYMNWYTRGTQKVKSNFLKTLHHQRCFKNKVLLNSWHYFLLNCHWICLNIL